ncbi:MAG: BON domain-containing protein [Dehalococcoidia bacterium]|nr:MAG: BON domain-containing protein [Dehalococcoidia bacterium]
MLKVFKMKWVLFAFVLLLTTVSFALPACTSTITETVRYTLTTTTTQQLDDEEIRSDIINQLSIDSRVDATNITVDVNNGKVILGGTIPSLQQARTVIQIVLDLPHTGIEDNMVVQPTEGADDEHIREHLVLLFDLAEDIDTSNVSISVNSGVVTLSGSIDHLWQKERLEEIAVFEESVVSIINNINVIDPTPVSDQQILDQVNNIIQIFGVDITAQIENGVVTLTGTVGYFDEDSLLSSIASAHGVVQIISNFDVAVE